MGSEGDIAPNRYTRDRQNLYELYCKDIQKRRDQKNRIVFE